MTELPAVCPGCGNPVSAQERLTGRCAKDGQPIDQPRSEVVLRPCYHAECSDCAKSGHACGRSFAGTPSHENCAGQPLLSEQTPVEIDTQIAALMAERYAEQDAAARAWDSVVFNVTEVMRHTGQHKGYGRVAQSVVRDFLSEYSEISESEEFQREAYPRAHVRSDAAKAWEAYLTHLDHDAKSDEVLMDCQPFEEEWERRGRWNRAFLVVTKGTGHVHRSMHCSTCYPTTQFHWMVEYSDQSEAEIVAAAGERACTVCYPSAPVDVKGTQMFSPDEKEKQARAAERARKSAEKKAAEITVVGYASSNFRDNTLRYADKVFKTTRAVTNDIAGYLATLAWYGTDHPSAPAWLANVEACRKALAAKGVDYDYDKALAAARKKTVRDGSQPKY